MLYSFIRLLIGVITFLIIKSIFGKIKKAEKRKTILCSAVISITITVFLSFIPFENAFMNFSTPQEAFSYYQIGKVNYVINGNNSSMVISSNRGVNEFSIIPKSLKNDGWKIGMGYKVKNFSSNTEKNVYTHIYKFTDSNDYYIFVYVDSEEQCVISDNVGSEFYCIDSGEKSGIQQYIAYLKCFNDEYVLSVDKTELGYSI